MVVMTAASKRWLLSSLRIHDGIKLRLSPTCWTGGERNAPFSAGCHRHRRLSHHLASSTPSATAEESLSSTRWGSLFKSHPADDNPTLLVDRLISYTRYLMSDHVQNSPSNQFRSIHHILAFSGGVDSSLVAALLQKCTAYFDQGGHYQHTVQAVLGVSPAVPREQVDMARRVATHLQIPLVEVPTTEGTDEVYRANAGQACLACKTHLYTCLQAVAHHATTTMSQTQESQNRHAPFGSVADTNTATPPLVRLYNGTNADDLLDSTRVGLLAAAQFQVSSPLQYITKTQVRMAARHLGLPNHHMAASPCLRSRLALGVEAIPEHLQRIEQAERHVRHALQLPETASFRVRLLARQRARLEVEEEYLEQAQQFLSMKGHLRSVLIHQLGFVDVTLAIFKSGSVARPILSTVTSSSSSSSKLVVEHSTPHAVDGDHDDDDDMMQVASHR